MQEDIDTSILPWKVWILIIITIQLFAVNQSVWAHQQMDDRLDYMQSLLNQHLQNEAGYHQNLEHSIELLVQNIQERNH